MARILFLLDSVGLDSPYVISKAPLTGLLFYSHSKPVLSTSSRLLLTLWKFFCKS